MNFHCRRSRTNNKDLTCTRIRALGQRRDKEIPKTPTTSSRALEDSSLGAARDDRSIASSAARRLARARAWARGTRGDSSPSLLLRHVWPPGGAPPCAGLPSGRALLQNSSASCAVTATVCPRWVLCATGHGHIAARTKITHGLAAPCYGAQSTSRAGPRAPGRGSSTSTRTSAPRGWLFARRLGATARDAVELPASSVLAALGPQHRPRRRHHRGKGRA